MLFLWWLWFTPAPDPEPVPEPEPLPVPDLTCPACGYALVEHGPTIMHQRQGRVTRYRHSGRACPITLPWVDDPRGY